MQSVNLFNFYLRVKSIGNKTSRHVVKKGDETKHENYRCKRL